MLWYLNSIVRQHNLSTDRYLSPTRRQINSLGCCHILQITLADPSRESSTCWLHFWHPLLHHRWPSLKYSIQYYLWFPFSIPFLHFILNRASYFITNTSRLTSFTTSYTQCFPLFFLHLSLFSSPHPWFDSLCSKPTAKHPVLNSSLIYLLHRILERIQVMKCKSINQAINQWTYPTYTFTENQRLVAWLGPTP